MPKIKAFKGIRYNTQKTNLATALCPPYDVISPKQSEDYHNKDQYNAIRLVLGKQLPTDSKDSNWYTRARDQWKEWIKSGVLARDTKPSIYYHEHEYTISDRPCMRAGFIALAKIDEDDKKNILPHENTHTAPKLDRLHLMNEVKANLSCVFGLYSDSSKMMSAKVKPLLKEPTITVNLPEGTQRFWVINDPAIIKNISNMMTDKPILIADGHHRYETAKVYRDRMRASTKKKDGNQPFDYVMMYFANVDDGLTILPTHRVIPDSMGIGLVDLEYRIKDIFNMIPFDNKKAFLTALNRGGKGNLGLLVKGISRYYILKLIDDEHADRFMPADIPTLLRRLDVTLLHTCIIEPLLGIQGDAATKTRINYVSDAKQALEIMETGKADITFMLNPSSIQEVMDIAKAGLRMPQKSTFFFPKIPTGLAFNSLEK
jgi:uncharacterized protein (DUF1015 family)